MEYVCNKIGNDGKFVSSHEINYNIIQLWYVLNEICRYLDLIKVPKVLISSKFQMIRIS